MLMVKICSVLMFAKGLSGCTAPQEEIDSGEWPSVHVYSKKQTEPYSHGSLEMTVCLSWILRQTHPQRNAGVLMPLLPQKSRYFTQHLTWTHLWSLPSKVFDDKTFCLHSGVYISNCLSEEENLPESWMLEEGRKKKKKKKKDARS